MSSIIKKLYKNVKNTTLSVFIIVAVIFIKIIFGRNFNVLIFR